MRALARGFLGTRGRTCRHISDRFSARFEEDDEPSLAPKRPQKSATEQGSRYLEDVTNTRLRRLANHSRTKALFDSPTEDHRKFPDKGSRFRVDASVFDESLHMQATQLEKLIKEGRKEREDTRQEHLRRAAKEKDLRARQGEVIREVRRPSVENIKSCSSGPPPADEQTSTTPSETKGAADEAKAAAAAATELAKQELSTEEETGCSQDNTVADESNLQQEVLSPRQLMARVGLVRPDSTRTGAMPTTPDIEKIVNSVAVLSRRKASQDREKLAGLLAQLEPELSRLTPSLCASVLVALPWVPQWTPQLLKRLAHQANALNTLTLATTLHGLGRLQKLAILQSFHNPEAIATCEAVLEVLNPLAKALKRQKQLQPLEAASLAISSVKATLRCSQSMRNFSATLLQHMETSPRSPLLARDVVACLAAFGAASVAEDDFLLAAKSFLRRAELEEVDSILLWHALRHLPPAKAKPFCEVLSLPSDAKSLVKLAAASIFIEEQQSKKIAAMLISIAGKGDLQLPSEVGQAMSVIGDQDVVNALAPAAAASATSWSCEDAVSCAEAVCVLPTSEAVKGLWRALFTACRNPNPSQALRFLAALAGSGLMDSPSTPRLLQIASMASAADWCAILVAVKKQQDLEQLGWQLPMQEAVKALRVPGLALLDAAALKNGIVGLCQDPLAELDQRLLQLMLLRVVEHAPTPIVRDALIAAGASASAACHLAALQLLHRRDTQTLLKGLWSELLQEPSASLAMSLGALGLANNGTCSMLLDCNDLTRTWVGANLRCQGQLKPHLASTLSTDLWRIAYAAAVEGDRARAEQFWQSTEAPETKTAMERYTICLLRSWLGELELLDDQVELVQDPLFCTALESAGVRGYNLGAATMELPEESLILDLCPWSAIPGHASLRRQLLSRAGVEVLTLPALGSAVEHANEVAKALISFRPSAFAHLVAQMGKELPHVKLGLSHRPGLFLCRW